jgi:histone deacetylase 11
MAKIKAKVVYSPNYDIQFMGMEKLHPFDSCKYSRAWNLLHKEFGKRLEEMTIAPSREISRDELLTVHTVDYLEEIKSSRYVAGAVELAFVAMFPKQLVDKHLLKPMRLATMGTILAAEEAMKGGLAVNMGGGYHHASTAKGEGFCIYSDVALAIINLRDTGKLKADETVLIIDLDVHQGNGHERIFLNDPHVKIMDVYNQGIYPNDAQAMRGIDCDVPLRSGTSEEEYLAALKLKLPEFLDSVDSPKFALYVAGTDIYSNDMLGMFRVSEAGILERDKFVFNALAEREIPFAMTLGGGYSQESYLAVANAVRYIIETW